MTDFVWSCKIVLINIYTANLFLIIILCVSGKKRFASYIKLQLSGDRSGRSSRNQSPDPPPRLNRSISGDQSPLAIRRNYLDSASPSFSRR